ncbi:MAG: SDR family oxidoreductase [Actinomycetota bacterium]|nr:SDR family oxidoreductase [Actinomycetota bacterium]
MSRVVVVTGASAGVGRATVRRFAEAGDSIALLARGQEGLAGARAEVEAAGARAMTIPLDVADAAAMDAAAARVEAELGPIDVWVNNAMTAVLAPVVETTAEEFRRVTEVTYLGYVHGTLAALRHMRPRDRGVIVQVGSGLAHRAIPLQATYCGAKFAIRGFTDSLRCELIAEGSGIRVTMVQLPGLNTPQFGWVKTTLSCHPRPVAPVYQPEVAAQVIVWAAEHPRREIFVGGITPLLIWGSRVSPWLVDRYLARTNIEAQQTEIPLPEGHRSYLWDSLPGDHSAHGIFDDESHDTSRQLWLTMHRAPVAGATATLVAVGGLLRRRGRTARR